MKLFFGSKAAKQREHQFATRKPEPEEPLEVRPRMVVPKEQPAPKPDTTTKSRDEVLRSLKMASSALAEIDTISKNVAAPKLTQNLEPDESKEKVRDRSLFKALLSGLYDGVIIFDAGGFVVGSSKRAEQFFGYGENEMWNMQCDKLFAAVNARVLQKIRQYAESGRFTVVNATCARKDGTNFPAEIAVSRINLFHEGDLIFSIRNLERREKAREHHEMELDALQYSGAAVLVCRNDGLIGYANPAFVRLLQAGDIQQVLNRFVGDFCTSYEAANAVLKMPSAGGSWLGRLELRRVDGATVEAIATAAISQRRSTSPANIVLTLTPLPKAVL